MQVDSLPAEPHTLIRNVLVVKKKEKITKSKIASKELVRRQERGGRHFLVVRHGPPIVAGRKT